MFRKLHEETSSIGLHKAIFNGNGAEKYPPLTPLAHEQDSFLKCKQHTFHNHRGLEKIKQF